MTVTNAHAAATIGGFILGGSLAGWPGAIVGAVVGFLAASYSERRERPR